MQSFPTGSTWLPSVQSSRCFDERLFKSPALYLSNIAIVVVRSMTWIKEPSLTQSALLRRACRACLLRQVTYGNAEHNIDGLSLVNGLWIDTCRAASSLWIKKWTERALRAPLMVERYTNRPPTPEEPRSCSAPHRTFPNSTRSGFLASSSFLSSRAGSFQS